MSEPGASAPGDAAPAPGRRRVSVPARRSSAATAELSCPALVVFSGGTAFNSLAGHLRQLTTRVAHVLPVSDDGGSTAEIVRVLGGPAVGDIRSRCLRLADDQGSEVGRRAGVGLPGEQAALPWSGRRGAGAAGGPGERPAASALAARATADTLAAAGLLAARQSRSRARPCA